MDFDLQFLSLWGVLLCLMELGRGRAVPVGRPMVLLAGIFAAAGLWLGAADTLYVLGYPEQCLILTPFHTQALTAEMRAEDDIALKEACADRVLTLNPYSAEAWAVKAEAAQAQGNLAAMMACSEKVLENKPYNRKGYEEYFDRLWTNYEKFRRAGDRKRQVTYREALLELPKKLEEVKRRSDSLAFRIQHKPELRLGAAYQAKLRALEGKR